MTTFLSSIVPVVIFVIICVAVIANLLLHSYLTRKGQ